jgi:hypothetical protein
MYKLKYIFSFIICYIIFRIIYNYFTNEHFIEHNDVSIGNDPSNGKFILPNGSPDQTIKTNGYSGRFIKIRPAAVAGQGWFHLSQVIVTDSTGTNIALNKPVYTTGKHVDNGNGLPGSAVVDGTTTPRDWPNVWHSMSDNRSEEYLEIDLQGIYSIDSIRIISRSGCCSSDYPDHPNRVDKTRIEINKTSDNFSGKEVYYIGWYDYTKAQAQQQCEAYGGTLATWRQVMAAYGLGAEWCAAGWVADSDTNIWPMQESKSGCGGPGISAWNPGAAGANCYGIKPPYNKDKPVIDFNGAKKLWNSPLVTAYLIDRGDYPSLGQFLVPKTASTDNTIQTNGYEGRYILVRPSTDLGDGWVGVTQLVVNDMNGNNIARGKPYYTTSNYPGSNPGYSVVDGITLPRGAPALWNPLTNNRDIEFLEIDLGESVAISSIRILSQMDAFTSTSDNDRTSRVRIGINKTSRSPLAMAAYAKQVKEKELLISDTKLGKEVYLVGKGSLNTEGQGQAICAAYGASVATLDQVKDAYMNGLSNCSWGWISEKNIIVLPNHEYPRPKGQEGHGWCGGLGISTWHEGSPNHRNVYCYGIKPPPGTPDISPFFVSNQTPKSGPDIWNSPTLGNTVNVMVTQPNGTIVATPCNGAKCKINCKLTYTPSGSCVLVSK